MGMKGIVQDWYGPADALELRDIEKHTPLDHEVVVRVHAAGLDHGVWHVMTGLPYLIRVMGYGLRKPKVAVRGNDVSGHVEKVGSGVTRFQPGDEVFGLCDGSFAEFACAKESKLELRPANVTLLKAAAVPVSAVTALQTLRDEARVEPGQSVLVIGASGGVGTYAVQIAKAFGAEVTGVSSATKMDMVRSIGADHIIDYALEDVVDGRRKYDVILDIAGNRSLSQLRRGLTPKGTLVIIGGVGRWQVAGGGGSPTMGDHTLAVREPESPREAPGGRRRGSARAEGPYRGRQDHPGCRQDLSPARRRRRRSVHAGGRRPREDRDHDVN